MWVLSQGTSEGYIISNWILVFCQLHRVTSGQRKAWKKPTDMIHQRNGGRGLGVGKTGCRDTSLTWSLSLPCRCRWWWWRKTSSPAASHPWTWPRFLHCPAGRPSQSRARKYAAWPPARQRCWGPCCCRRKCWWRWLWTGVCCPGCSCPVALV